MSVGLVLWWLYHYSIFVKRDPLQLYYGKEEPRLLRVLYSSILSHVLQCRGSLLVLQNKDQGNAVYSTSVLLTFVCYYVLVIWLVVFKKNRI